MEIEHLLTPYKYGYPILSASGREGEFDKVSVDCPTLFYHHEAFYMMYVGYDGIGYQTALAVSDDLLHWRKLGVILRRGGHMEWDKVGMAGTTLLMENDLFAERRLKKYNGRYWMLYHSYPKSGYEAGAAETGLAWTEDENLTDWHFEGAPVLSWRDGEEWERGGLYKSWLMEKDGTFYLFYNAKSQESRSWTEQIGYAVSADLIHWERGAENPVLRVCSGGWDSRFNSDPQVYWDSIGKQWVMYYYGLGNLSACEGLAVSDDLAIWRKYPIPILTIGCRGSVDELFAHKPGMIWHDGVLYHFYCAVRPSVPQDETNEFSKEYRCITAAADQPWKAHENAGSVP